MAVVEAVTGGKYGAEQVQKAIVAFVVSALGLIGLFVALDPNTVESIVAVTIAAANVYGVFKRENAPVD